MIRAHESLRTLQRAIKRFLEGHPYTINKQFDRESREHFITVSIDQRAPVEAWSAHIGEATHNMRSSLDHLVWQLTLMSAGPAPNPLPRRWRQIEFPIFNKREAYEGEFGWRRKIWGLSQSNRAIIERLQPFGSGEPTAHQHPLWVLHELNNIDKHRSLNIVGAAMAVSRLEFEGPGGLHVEIRHQSTGSFHDGAELARFFIPPEFHTAVELIDRYRFDVAFDEGAPTYGGRVLETLTAIYNMVGCTLRAFSKQWQATAPDTFAFNQPG